RGRRARTRCARRRPPRRPRRGSPAPRGPPEAALVVAGPRVDDAHRVDALVLVAAAVGGEEPAGLVGIDDGEARLPGHRERGVVVELGEGVEVDLAERAGVAVEEGLDVAHADDARHRPRPAGVGVSRRSRRAACVPRSGHVGVVGGLPGPAPDAAARRAAAAPGRAARALAAHDGPAGDRAGRDDADRRARPRDRGRAAVSGWPPARACTGSSSRRRRSRRCWRAWLRSARRRPTPPARRRWRSSPPWRPRSRPSRLCYDVRMTTAAAAPDLDPTPARRRRLTAEIWIVMGLSLGRSGVYAVVTILDRLTRGPLGDQTATLNPPQADRPLLDLTYQLLSLGFALVPVALALYLLSEGGRSAVRRIGLDGTRPGTDALWALGLGALIGVPGLGLYLLG